MVVGQAGRTATRTRLSASRLDDLAEVNAGVEIRDDALDAVLIGLEITLA